MIAIDTSVVVALFASWHERHGDAAALLVDEQPVLIAHCAIETYSVLTRLPPPHRAPPDVVRDFLVGQFPGTWLTLRERETRRALRALPQQGIRGGATYDAIIAATASAAKLTLVSFDARAARTYAAMGAAFQLA
jgi:predicted nucleic acid-binding protein